MLFPRDRPRKEDLYRGRLSDVLNMKDDGDLRIMPLKIRDDTLQYFRVSVNFDDKIMEENQEKDKSVARGSRRSANSSPITIKSTGSRGGARKRKREKQAEIIRNEKLQRKKSAVSDILGPVVEALWAEVSDQVGNPFRVIIDKNSIHRMGIPNYFDHVAHPMNLQYMKDKIERSEYASVKDFESDLELMIKNSKAYNGEDHEVSRFGVSLQQLYSKS